MRSTVRKAVEVSMDCIDFIANIKERKEVIRRIVDDIINENMRKLSIVGKLPDYYPAEDNVHNVLPFYTFVNIKKVWRSKCFIGFEGVVFPHSNKPDNVYDYAFEICSGYIFEAKSKEGNLI